MGAKFRYGVAVILFFLPILLGVSPDSLILNITSWDRALSSFVLLHRDLVIFGLLILFVIFIVPPRKYRALVHEISFFPNYIGNFARLTSEIFSKTIQKSGRFYLGRIYVVFTNLEINKTIDFQFYFYNGNYERVKISAVEGFIDFETDKK
ncbi:MULTISPECIES: hypothetical protein [Acidiphilium]|uniref:hypothetical protein n=1 Tax=Acidiphilium TaxID=522 RepID=UPI00257ACABD|nr:MULTISPECIES: hypothetical protein [Acidiphilium]HQT85104.1 hypothetical protein [Acidiphilium rubrum]